jgi:lipoate-protein ligase A
MNVHVETDNGPAAATGVRTLTATGAVSRDRALLAAHAAGESPDRIAFHQVRPAVSIGCHQTFEHEVRRDYCAEAGVDVVRRATAGGALYLDEGQLGVSLVLPAEALGARLSERLQTGAAIVADALSRIGVETEFKPPNDLQVAGRQKIASVFLAGEGGTALLGASIILRLDLKSAMQALLVPTEKLTVTGLEHAKERMTSLEEVLGWLPRAEDVAQALAAAAEARLGRTFVIGADGPLTAEPPAEHPWDLGEARFETKDKVAGATLRVLLGIGAEDIAADVRFATDGHLSPADTLPRLAEHLRGRNVSGLAAAADAWLAAEAPDMAGFEPSDLVKLIDRAAAKWSMQEWLGLTPAQTSGLMLAGQNTDPAHALERASVMLVPYCAKPSWCKWRHTMDCVECGKCEVGDAYLMARERNMEVVTITNFEHLADTLTDMKAQGVESYVGMCCGEFFLKRHHAFRDSGMDAVLLDIEGATCYELKEEQLAYAGKFTAEAALDLDAVKKVMARVPAQDASRRPCLTGTAPRVGERHHDLVAGCKSCSCTKSGTGR